MGHFLLVTFKCFTLSLTYRFAYNVSGHRFGFILFRLAELLESVDLCLSQTLGILEFPLISSLYLQLLCWDLLAFYVSRVFALTFWSSLIIVAWKSLSDNSYMHVILALASIFFFLPCKVEIFLVLHMLITFRLHPGYFEYYVMAFWVFVLFWQIMDPAELRYKFQSTFCGLFLLHPIQICLARAPPSGQFGTLEVIYPVV